MLLYQTGQIAIHTSPVIHKKFTSQNFFPLNEKASKRFHCKREHKRFFNRKYKVNFLRHLLRVLQVISFFFSLLSLFFIPFVHSLVDYDDDKKGRSQEGVQKGSLEIEICIGKKFGPHSKIENL